MWFSRRSLGRKPDSAACVGVERSITPVGLQIWLAETGFQTRRALCLCLADEPREESQDVSAGEGGSWAAVIAYDPLVVSKPRSNSIRGNSTVSLLHYKTNRVLRRRSLRWATMRAALVFCTARSHALPQRLLGRRGRWRIRQGVQRLRAGDFSPEQTRNEMGGQVPPAITQFFVPLVRHLDMTDVPRKPMRLQARTMYLGPSQCIFLRRRFGGK